MPDMDPLKLFDWDVSPPLEQVLYIPILSPSPGTRVRGVVLSERLVGVWTHWRAGRTEPHHKDQTGCPGCREGLARRWKGYLGIWWPAGSRVALAELTVGAARLCPVLSDPMPSSLRGWLLTLARPFGKMNGPVSIELSPPPAAGSDDGLKPAPDVRRALLVIWERREDGPSGVLSAEEGPEEAPF